jgi:hypothetical protein
VSETCPKCGFVELRTGGNRTHVQDGKDCLRRQLARSQRETAVAVGFLLEACKCESFGLDCTAKNDDECRAHILAEARQRAKDAK